MVAGAATATAAGEYRGGGEQNPGQEGALHVRSTITEVALTAAVAGTPGARPSSSTESRVTAAVIRCGPASISTSAITPSTSTDVITPGKRLRAERLAALRWRLGELASRVISDSDTRRRLLASRVVFS